MIKNYDYFQLNCPDNASQCKEPIEHRELCKEQRAYNYGRGCPNWGRGCPHPRQVSRKAHLMMLCIPPP